MTALTVYQASREEVLSLNLTHTPRPSSPSPRFLLSIIHAEISRRERHGSQAVFLEPESRLLLLLGRRDSTKPRARSLTRTWMLPVLLCIWFPKQSTINMEGERYFMIGEVVVFLVVKFII